MVKIIKPSTAWARAKAPTRKKLKIKESVPEKN